MEDSRRFSEQSKCFKGFYYNKNVEKRCLGGNVQGDLLHQCARTRFFLQLNFVLWFHHTRWEVINQQWWSPIQVLTRLDVANFVDITSLPYTYLVPHSQILPSAVLSSQTGPPFSLGHSRPSPHKQTLTCVAIQPHVALVCHLNGLQPQYCILHVRNNYFRWPAV